MLSLILTAALTQCPGGACTATVPAHPAYGAYLDGPRWWTLTTRPGWQGYGVRYAAGVVVQQYRPVPAAAAVPQASLTDETAAFLAALNAWRQAYGVHPASWDYDLASWAARETGIHSVLAPGASQTWAGTSSLMGALAMWEASPAHAAILLSGSVVGAAPCPSGATCNVR